jgi:hypothetical protein
MYGRSREEYREQNEQTAMWLPKLLMAEVRKRAKREQVPLRAIMIRALSRYLYEGEGA